MAWRSLLIVTLLVAGIGIANWQEAPRAAACSCAVTSSPELAKMADLVAEGVVVGVDRPAEPQSSAEDVTYSVELTRVWKGPDLPQVAVLSAVSGASCGLEGIDEGAVIALFSKEDGDAWRSNLCDGTGPMTDAVEAELTAALGEPTKVTAMADTAPAPQEEPANRSAWLVGGLAAAGIALIALAGVAFARRRTSG